MRAKLVHGTNSMTWANKVLPTCMRTPRGSQPEETTPFLANEVQIGTKRNRPATRANARSRARHRSFNRTVVKRLILRFNRLIHFYPPPRSRQAPLQSRAQFPVMLLSPTQFC